MTCRKSGGAALRCTAAEVRPVEALARSGAKELWDCLTNMLRGENGFDYLRGVREAAELCKGRLGVGEGGGGIGSMRRATARRFRGLRR